MDFYNNVILPTLCHLAMRNRRLVPYRERVIGGAEGRVLEIGIGSGLNLPFYRAPVSEIVALEPAPPLIAMARRSVQPTAMRVSFIEGSAEAIPLDDHSIDTVVTTWTLCTIPQVANALGEMRRVLKPGGRLLFVEHGMCISGGCHLNRPIQTIIERAGFRCDRLETGYMPGPKPMAFIYEGSVRPD